MSSQERDTGRPVANAENAVGNGVADAEDRPLNDVEIDDENGQPNANSNDGDGTVKERPTTSHANANETTDSVNGAAGDAITAFLGSLTHILRSHASEHLLSDVDSDISLSSGKSNASAAKVQAPKNFMINQNFRIWLERFNTYASLARVSMTDRKEQLLSRLDHQAYVAVSNLHLPSSLSYSEFTAALTKRFHNVTREDYKLQLRARVQSSSESFEAYSDGLQELAMNAYPNGGFDLQQEMALDQFLVGVRIHETLKQQLLMSSPTRIEEAIRKTRQLEAAQLVLRQGTSLSTHSSKPKIANVKTEKPSVAASLPNTSNQSTEMGKILLLLEKMESRISELEKGNVDSSRSKQCWRCHGDGHGPSGCPTVECFACHELGHMSHSCPNKESGNAKRGLSRGGQSQ